MWRRSETESLAAMVSWELKAKFMIRALWWFSYQTNEPVTKPAMELDNQQAVLNPLGLRLFRS